MENEEKRKTSDFFQKDIDKGELRWYNNTRREKCAGVAQLAEQLICNQQVGGSNPSTSSTLTFHNELNMGEFPSGQRGQTVNLLSLTSVVRIHLPPPSKRTSNRMSFLLCLVGKRRWIRKPVPIV